MRTTIMLGVVLASAFFAGACAANDQQQVSIVDTSNAGASADDGNSDTVDSEAARSFAPVDAQPGDPTITPQPEPVVTSSPRPPESPPEPLEPPAPPALPTPDGAPTGQPRPPLPPAWGGANECGVSFPNPAIIVWGVDEANPDQGIWVHEAPTYGSERQRLLPRDALTQFMTSGCKLGVDGTPWYEFGSSTGEIGYADSTFLRFSQPACLVGIVEALDPTGNIAAIWSGPVEGHAYSDGGSSAAFIPNEQIGSGHPYRLVPATSVIFAESFGTAPCALSDRQSEVDAAVIARVERPPYRGDCTAGPIAPFGPTLLVDIDGVAPIDGIMLTATQPVRDALFATLTVLIGTDDGGRCSWRDVANVYAGPLDRDDGRQDQYVWSCFDDGDVKLVQHLFDADPTNGATVTTLTLADGEMRVDSVVRVTGTIDTTSTCEIGAP